MAKTVRLTAREIDALCSFIEFFMEQTDGGVVVRNQKKKFTIRELENLDKKLKEE